MGFYGFQNYHPIDLAKIDCSNVLRTLNVFNSLLFCAFRFSQTPYTLFDYTKKRPGGEQTEWDESEEQVSQSKCFLLVEVRTDSAKFQFINKMYRTILENVSFYQNFRVVLRNNFLQKRNLMGNLNLVNQK